MKESTLSKITASVAVAKGMAQRALAASPNPQRIGTPRQSMRRRSIPRQGGQVGTVNGRQKAGANHVPSRIPKSPHGKRFSDYR